MKLTPLPVVAASLALLMGASTSSHAISTKSEQKVAAKASGKTKGFVMTHFWYEMAFNPDDCPDGLAISLPGGINAPPQYDAGRKDRKFTRIPPPRGEDDQCTSPASFEDPPMRTGKGRISYGMNLDGSTSASDTPPNMCTHENFTGVDGSQGVDNQLYRILGCINAYRPENIFQGNVVRDFVVSARQDGQVSTVMEITGIDDEMNDSDVKVGFYSSSNPTHYDAFRKGIPYTSLTVHKNPRWQNVVQGRIVNGVITTDPADIRLDHYQGEGLKDHTDMFIRGARVRLQIAADGTLKGVLAGYSDVEHVYKMEFGMGPSVLPKSWGWTCPSVYAALHKLADGYKDPNTGKCTAISTSYEIEAVPAFLIHQKDATTSAKAGD